MFIKRHTKQKHNIWLYKCLSVLFFIQFLTSGISFHLSLIPKYKINFPNGMRERKRERERAII